MIRIVRVAITVIQEKPGGEKSEKEERRHDGGEDLK